MKDQHDDIIKQALQILEQRMKYASTDVQVTSTNDARDYARLKLAEYQQEVFSVMFLDNQHYLISYEEMFFGTINEADVYPREIIRRILEHNSAAVIIMHNHPSGDSRPSDADIRITRKLRDALGLFDIRMLDHLIVGREIYSMAENGEI